MSLQTSAELIDVLRRERIVADQDLERAARLAGELPLAADLGGRLRREGVLTAFQLDAIRRGKAAELVLRDYVLLEPRGEGAMGKVYKARHRIMNRLAAVKVVRPEALGTEQVVKRFEREMQVAAQVDHPNIVRAQDAGQANGTYFYVMEYVEGIDFATLVHEEGPLPVGLACEFARRVALGLQHLHERGLVHRDIKPQNVMAVLSKTKGSLKDRNSFEGVKILDLGLAVFRPPETQGKTVMRLTRLGAAMGTPDFMAPEQSADAHGVDIRADLYSLGCTLYYLLTADTLYHAGSTAQKVFQHRSMPIPDVRQLRADVPEGLGRVLGRLLAKKPEDRFQTPGEAATALEAYCEGMFVTAAAARKSRTLLAGAQPTASCQTVMGQTGSAPPASLAPERATPYRWAWVLGGTGMFCVGLAALLFALLGRGNPAPQKEPDVDEPKLVLRPPTLEGKKKGPGEGGTKDPKKVEEKPPDAPAPVAKQKIPEPFGHSARVWSLALSRDGKRLHSGSYDGTIKIWDLEHGTEILHLRHTGPIWSLALSGDGERIVSASVDKTIKVWHLESGKDVMTLLGHTDYVMSLALSSDGKRLFSGSGDKTIKVWDLESGAETLSLRGHTDAVWSLVMGRSGKRLFSGGGNTGKAEIKVWDLESRKEIMELHGHKDYVMSLALSSDGKRLFSGSADNTIKVWDLELGAELLLDAACFPRAVEAPRRDNLRYAMRAWPPRP